MTVSDRQHDAFDNPAKMACREDNLRVLLLTQNAKDQEAVSVCVPGQQEVVRQRGRKRFLRHVSGVRTGRGGHPSLCGKRQTLPW
jgi:hypothetical protein